MVRNTSFALLMSLAIAVMGCSGGPGSVPAVNKAGGGPSASSSSISISPASDTLRIGGQRRFSGWDPTVGQYFVTWSLQEGAAGGSITADGLYTAPTTTGTFHLIATSKANTSITGTAPVTVVSIGFVPIADMATARSGHTATPLLDGRVLVAGGTLDAAHSAELFDAATSSFNVVTGAMAQVRTGHCASLLQDGRVLIAGGGNGSGTLFKTAELFDPTTQSFAATGDLNQARTGATATPLSSGKVLITGGKDSTGSLLSTAELYDPASASFSVTGKMQLPRAQHTATLLDSGKVLLIGSSTDTASAEIYDPATGIFTSTGSLNQARAHHTATRLTNGKVLVMGGTQKQEPGGGGAAAADVSLASVEVYDPASGSFQAAGNLLIARDSHSATPLPNGMVLAAGGYSHGFDGDADPTYNTMFQAELFDPVTFLSTSAASLEQDRAGHTATMLNNGQVLVTGGISGFLALCCSPNPVTGKLSSSELYK